MISAAVIFVRYAYRSDLASKFATASVAEKSSTVVHVHRMISHDEILSELELRKAAGALRNKDLAALLELPSSRVAEIFARHRRLTHDEIAKISVRYGINGAFQADVPFRHVEVVLQPLLEALNIDEPTQKAALKIALSALRTLQSHPGADADLPVRAQSAVRALWLDAQSSAPPQ